MHNHYDSKHSRVTLKYTSMESADSILDSLRDGRVPADNNAFVESVTIVETRRIKWSINPVAASTLRMEETA